MFESSVVLYSSKTAPVELASTLEFESSVVLYSPKTKLINLSDLDWLAFGKSSDQRLESNLPPADFLNAKGVQEPLAFPHQLNKLIPICSFWSPEFVGSVRLLFFIRVLFFEGCLLS